MALTATSGNLPKRSTPARSQPQPSTPRNATPIEARHTDPRTPQPFNPHANPSVSYHGNAILQKWRQEHLTVTQDLNAIHPKVTAAEQAAEEANADMSQPAPSTSGTPSQTDSNLVPDARIAALQQRRQKERQKYERWDHAQEQLCTVLQRREHLKRKRRTYTDLVDELSAVLKKAKDNGVLHETSQEAFDHSGGPFGESKENSRQNEFDGAG